MPKLLPIELANCNIADTKLETIIAQLDLALEERRLKVNKCTILMEIPSHNATFYF